jgi:hypothetical protein
MAAAFLGGLGLVLGGCATGLGPKAIRSERPDYNQQIVRSSDEQMLLNLVRLRYNDTPLFLELGSVVTSYGYEAALSAGGTISPNPGGSSASLGTGLSYSESHRDLLPFGGGSVR